MYELMDETFDNMYNLPECADLPTTTDEKWDEKWTACASAVWAAYDAKKADLFLAKKIPADLADIEEVIYWARNKTTWGETTVADLDVWKEALTTDEMISWTTCR